MTDHLLPPDYSQRIDAETWAFIRETEGFYPPDSADHSVARQRALYDRMARHFHRPHPPGIRSRDERLGQVACRIYEAAAGAAVTILYFHGGGFILGGLDSHDDVCAELCAATGYRVLSADYRLAPEHPHPAPFLDAQAVLSSLVRRWPGPVVLAGDSAGGTLAATLAHAARKMAGRPEIRGLVLIYPTLSPRMSGGSRDLHAHAPMLTTGDLAYYRTVRFAGGVTPQADPTAYPLADPDFAGLPPTLIHAAECDPLADDGADYAARIQDAGGTAHAVTDAGLVHGWLRARHRSSRAAAAFAAITASVAALGRGEVPWRGTL